jgi:hypothetical protein
LHYGKEPGHYELHIDASSFIPEPEWMKESDESSKWT